MYTCITATDVADKTLLVRADLNVPIRDGIITNDERLQRLVPGLNALLGRGAKVVVLSHFGRPKGHIVPEMSLAPVANALGSLLSHPLGFVTDTTGPKAAAAVATLNPGEALVLENLRFHPGEEANDADFARELAALGQIFVNDAFSAAHRAHASTDGLARLLPAFAGELMDAELRALDTCLGTPERPVMALVGGAKVSTKFDLLFNLVTKVDCLVIGGGMANTFLAAQGVAVGRSLCEPDLAERAREVLGRAQAAGCEIILPQDGMWAPGLDAGSVAESGPLSDLPQDQMILDFGPKTIAQVLDRLPDMKTLIWNGPMGAFEFEPFDEATSKIAISVAGQTKAGNLQSVAGGGDTVAALEKAGVLGDFTYISTAGGAFLEWMEGRDLPGVIALG